jgi:hypothetical protein
MKSCLDAAANFHVEIASIYYWLEKNRHIKEGSKAQ